jgi:hypothetical protein
MAPVERSMPAVIVATKLAMPSLNESMESPAIFILAKAHYSLVAG